MAGFEVTSPDNIAKAVTGSPASIVQVSQAQGDSVQTAFSKRQRYDFVWATSAERTAQTGMVQGSRGYQIDTRSNYIYDNSNWRLSSSYIEMTSSTGSVATATAASIGSLTVNTTNSTDTTFVSAGSGAIIIARPGIYSIQLLGKENGSNPCTGQSQIVITTSNLFSSVPDRLSNGMFSGALMATAVLPFFRVTTSNTDLFFRFFNDSGANRTINCQVAVGRIG